MRARFLTIGLFLAVGCKDPSGPATGSALVTVTTSGVGGDTTSRYALSVDGGTGKPIASNGSMTIVALSVGDHRMTLAGIPPNCSVAQNPRTVTITASATTTVPFVVSCVAPSGYIQVTTATTGVDLDPDGYALSIDQQAAQPLGVNATVTIPNLTVGSHSVALSGVAANCTLAGADPANVTVANGDTVRITFSIGCVALGWVRVATATTGVDLDLNGYTVFVDGTRAGAAAVNGVATLPAVASGTRAVQLADVSSNCAVAGSNPRSVAVPVHDTAQVTFQVSCVHTDQIAFAGVDYNTGYYQIFVINADGSSLVQVTSIPAYEAGPAWSPDGSKIAFHTNRDGNYEIYAMNADGSGLTRLTSDPAADVDPAWSPDGSKIAFSSNRDGTDGLYLMNRDGSGVSKVTSGLGGFHPTWSPDGTRIAFECHVDVGNRDICVINSDGTGLVRLTSDPAADYGAAWKPDGSKILFVTTRSGNTQLALMNPDGTGVTSLFSDPFADFLDQPAWSPTGAKIALHEVRSDCSSSGCYSYDVISVANADGTGAGVLAYGISPAWRP